MLNKNKYNCYVNSYSFVETWFCFIIWILISIQFSVYCTFLIFSVSKKLTALHNLNLSKIQTRIKQKPSLSYFVIYKDEINNA